MKTSLLTHADRHARWLSSEPNTPRRRPYTRGRDNAANQHRRIVDGRAKFAEIMEDRRAQRRGTDAGLARDVNAFARHGQGRFSLGRFVPVILSRLFSRKTG